MLIIRDGWGINPGGAAKRDENGDATLLAHTPFHDELYREYPWQQIERERPRCRIAGRADGQLGSWPSQSRRGPDRLSGSHANQQGDCGR